MPVSQVLDYWFGDRPVTPQHLEDRNLLWFAGGESVDREIKERFESLVTEALAGGLADWEDAAPSRLALIIVLDQFTRNIFRGDAAAFGGDARALALALDGIESGMDKQLGVVERTFFCLPLEHAESEPLQSLCVATLDELAAACAPSYKSFVQNSRHYAAQHRDIIATYGRFPHRNVILGRPSTAEETAYLTNGGATFGQ